MLSALTWSVVLGLLNWSLLIMYQPKALYRRDFLMLVKALEKWPRIRKARVYHPASGQPQACFHYPNSRGHGPEWCAGEPSPELHQRLFWCNHTVTPGLDAETDPSRYIWMGNETTGDWISSENNGISDLEVTKVIQLTYLSFMLCRQTG